MVVVIIILIIYILLILQKASNSFVVDEEVIGVRNIQTDLEVFIGEERFFFNSEWDKEPVKGFQD